MSDFHQKFDDLGQLLLKCFRGQIRQGQKIVLLGYQEGLQSLLEKNFRVDCVMLSEYQQLDSTKQLVKQYKDDLKIISSCPWKLLDCVRAVPWVICSNVIEYIPAQKFLYDTLHAISLIMLQGGLIKINFKNFKSGYSQYVKHDQDWWRGTLGMYWEIDAVDSVQETGQCIWSVRKKQDVWMGL